MSSSATAFSTSVYAGDVMMTPVAVSVVALTLSAVTFIIMLMAIVMQRYQLCEDDGCKNCAKNQYRMDMRRNKMGYPGGGGGAGGCYDNQCFMENENPFSAPPPPAYTMGQLHSRGGPLMMGPLTAAPPASSSTQNA
uniref:Isolate HZ419 ORF59 protein n=1 Tax=Cyprinid herpesvirus 3 TaxID=180230 RepID=A0A0C5AZA1_CYHV3|nr:ORF59 [Cyprinid herpesvirus 3]